MIFNQRFDLRLVIACNVMTHFKFNDNKKKKSIKQRKFIEITIL